jgi:putative ABC transport system ATP-binding protein
MALLEWRWNDLGLTMVIVTHDSSVARRARKTGQMRNGKLTVQANAQD